MTNGDESASPIYDFIAPNTLSAHSLGLTKREYFAGLALQGVLANCTDWDASNNAELALSHADALLAELEK